MLENQWIGNSFDSLTELYHSRRLWSKLNRLVSAWKDKIYTNNTIKQWYYDKGIPYTLGIGLHGPPGTGLSAWMPEVNRTDSPAQCEDIQTDANGRWSGEGVVVNSRGATFWRASRGHGKNQSNAVQDVMAGNFRQRTRKLSPTGDIQRTTCRF